jgi:hypothetical protein
MDSCVISGKLQVSKAAALKGKPGVSQAEFRGYRLAVSAVDSRDTFSVGGVRERRGYAFVKVPERTVRN